MNLIPAPLERLTKELSRFPGVGTKTAQRLALYCLKNQATFPDALASALLAVKDTVGRCRVCGFIAEGDLCEICRSPSRETSVICVVEQPLDVLAIERSAEYHGTYHVLWGALSPIDGIGPAELGVERLLERVRRTGTAEVILATNPNVEGEATAHYLATALADQSGVTVSRLAYGLPAGADVEYADALTVARALSGRRAYG